MTNFYTVSIYSSDLNTMLFFFPKIKSHLKSRSKENHQGIITPSMHSFPRESFQKIYNIFHKIISTFFFFSIFITFQTHLAHFQKFIILDSFKRPVFCTIPIGLTISEQEIIFQTIILVSSFFFFAINSCALFDFSFSFPARTNNLSVFPRKYKRFRK